MRILTLLAFLLVAVVVTGMAKAKEPAKRSKPNVILIMADDMGYADVERFGKLNIPTPALNRLCDEGVKFTDAYVTAPICVASRMGLMSGRHQQRFGVYGNFNAPNQQKLALRSTVLPRPFQQNGYRTALVGKWHLSGNSKDDWQLPGPLTRGFDECVAITGGGSSFWAGARVIRQEKFEKSPVYLTDLWGTEAADFIEINAKRPFFLYLAFNAVHAPLHALDDDIAPFAKTIKDPNRRIYAGMQLAMDRAVGQVLDELDKQEIADDTIVIFLNDNGGGGSTEQYASHSRNYANNSPFRGHKFDVFEGGIRVPMMMRWPGHLKAGSVYSKMVSSADIYRTVVSAAELEMPAEKFDSVNLLPYLTGKEKGEPHDWLCWQNRSRLPKSDGGLYKPRSREHNCAIRKGNWKLVRLNENIDSKSRPPAWQLYDLASDVGEQHDVAARHPEVVRELGQLFNAWRADMHPSIAAPARRKPGQPVKK
jgi:arylsulfatase A-like enzyme